MPSVNFSDGLKTEYERLFNSCEIRADKMQAIEKLIQTITSNKTRYESVASKLGIPWYVIACIHNMESSLNFNCHLHNGDPLSSRTKNVPAGRPIAGKPPFTWEVSAMDSLSFQRFDLWSDWSLPGILYKLEGYNGWGYRNHHPEILSPYLWSGSNHYSKGKYIADGRWSDTAVSSQIGASVILRRMSEKNIVSFINDHLVSKNKPMLYYSDKKIKYADELQKFLNGFPGIYVSVDSKPGISTSEAFKKVTGSYLNGDPRNS